MFTIEYAVGVAQDLKKLRAFDRQRVLDGIERQLSHQPTKQARNKKIIIGLSPPWEFEEPIWELRIGPWRVFYDVDGDEMRVVIRAIRHKPPHTKTEDIL